jgi:enoyl-CoA hydratase/carnithine racemase
LRSEPDQAVQREPERGYRFAQMSANHAHGAAIAFALVLDGLVMERDASVRHPHRRQGVAFAGGATKRLALQIGPAPRKEFILLGRAVSADVALEWGVVRRTAEKGDLLKTAAQLLTELADDWDEVELQRRLLVTTTFPEAGNA